MRIGEWSETAHLDRYFALIQGIKAGRGNPAPPRPKLASMQRDPSRAGLGLERPLTWRSAGRCLRPRGCSLPRLLREPRERPDRPDRRRRPPEPRPRPARRGPLGRQRPDPVVPAPSPGHLPVDREPRTPPALGRSRVRRPSARRQPARRPLLPADLAGLVERGPSDPRLDHRRPSPVCGMGNLPPGPDARDGRMGLPGGGRVLRGFTLRPGPGVRGALSARLGRLLVSLGFRLGDPTSPGAGSIDPGAGRDPGGDLPRRPPARRVLPAPRPGRVGGPGCHRLDGGRALAGGRPVLGCVGGRHGPGGRPDWRRADPRRDGPTLVPPRRHAPAQAGGPLSRLHDECPPASQPGVPRRAGRVFRARELLGVGPVDRPGPAGPGDRRRLLVGRPPRGSGLAAAGRRQRRLRLGPQARAVRPALRGCAGDGPLPGPRAVVVPGEPGRLDARGDGRRGPPGEIGRRPGLGPAGPTIRGIGLDARLDGRGWRPSGRSGQFLRDGSGDRGRPALPGAPSHLSRDPTFLGAMGEDRGSCSRSAGGAPGGRKAVAAA